MEWKYPFYSFLTDSDSNSNSTLLYYEMRYTEYTANLKVFFVRIGRAAWGFMTWLITVMTYNVHGFLFTSLILHWKLKSGTKTKYEECQISKLNYFVWLWQEMAKFDFKCLLSWTYHDYHLSKTWQKFGDQGRIVQKPVNANSGLTL